MRAATKLKVLSVSEMITNSERMINKLAMNLVDYDPMAVAQRGIDTRRYTQWVWSRSHTDPIDEEQLCLFLTDESYGDLTEEQKSVACTCRDQMRSAFGAAVFRMIQFDEMMCLGMIPDFRTFREVLSPQSSYGGDDAPSIYPRLDERISADLRGLPAEGQARTPTLPEKAI